MVPFMRTFGYDIRKSIATAAAVGFLIALSGTLTMITGGELINNVTSPFSLGYINLLGFIVFVPVTMIMARVGAKAVYKIDKKLLGITCDGAGDGLSATVSILSFKLSNLLKTSVKSVSSGINPTTDCISDLSEFISSRYGSTFTSSEIIAAGSYTTLFSPKCFFGASIFLFCNFCSSNFF